MGEDDPLRRAVGEVALVPEGDVLQGRRHERPDDSGERADIFRGDRVLLLSHRGAPDLLLRLEGFGDLADLRALQIPDFRAELLEGGRDVREDADELRIPIAANNLRRRFFDTETEVPHDRRLDVEGIWPERRTGPNRPGHLADDDPRGRLPQPVAVARDLGGEDRHLESERNRDRGLPVRPAEHHGPLVFRRQAREYGREFAQVLAHDADRIPQLERRRGIEDVVARRAEVDVFSRLAVARFGQGEDDRHQVVTRLLLDLLDALDRHPFRRGLLRDLGRRGLGDQPDLRLHASERRLDLEQALEPRLFLEDPFHLRPAVAEVDGAQQRHGHRRPQSPEVLWSFLPRARAYGGVGVFGRTTVKVDPSPGADTSSSAPPGGPATTVRVEVEETPAESVTFRVTVYVPAAVYAWVGFCVLSVPPSPNVHAYV